jgi:hypothetical protein
MSSHPAWKGLAVESSVPVTVTLRTEHADVGSLERSVSAALAEIGQALWAHLIAELERTVPRPVACRRCGASLKANGRATRRLVTLAGEVELRRRRYRCRGCGMEHVPLDEALGLEPRTQHTLGLRERALYLVTELSYQRTVEVAAELRGWPIGRGELHRWVAEEGARLEAVQAAAQADIFERGRLPDAPRRGTVWISADGTMVHDRASGTEFEVKAGLVFEGAQRIGLHRHRLRERELYADTVGWHAFAERFVAGCARLGVFEAERINFVSDGAAALRWLRRTYFPTAIELLDWFHLTEQLRFGVGLAHPERLEQALALGRAGRAAALAELLLAHATDLDGVDADQARRARAVAGYVTNNALGITNYAIVPMPSSGPMEKAVDITVCRRFKLRGMSWFRRGVGHLLRLRLLRLNGTWDRYWRGRFAAALRPWPSPA